MGGKRSVMRMVSRPLFACRASMGSSVVRTLIASLSAAALLSGCVPKPDHQPFATFKVEVARENRGTLDATLSEFAAHNGFRIAIGDVGANDLISHVIHLVRQNAQIIASDPFNPQCFGVSLYGAGFLHRLDKAEMQSLATNLESALRSQSDLKMLTEPEADMRNC